MIIPIISPLNDTTFLATLKTIDQDPQSATYGKEVLFTTGTVTAFIAISNAADAVALDNSLSVTCTYIATLKKWLVHFDASIMTVALLRPAFAGGVTPYIILQSINNRRVYIECEYADAQSAEVS